MFFNKNKYKKVNDKKVLHKIGKHWAVISTAMLALLAGGAMAGVTTHASTTQTVPNQANYSTQYKQNSAKNSSATNSSNNSSSMDSMMIQPVSPSAISMPDSNNNSESSVSNNGGDSVSSSAYSMFNSLISNAVNSNMSKPSSVSNWTPSYSAVPDSVNPSNINLRTMQVLGSNAANNYKGFFNLYEFYNYEFLNRFQPSNMRKFFQPYFNMSDLRNTVSDISSTIFQFDVELNNKDDDGNVHKVSGLRSLDNDIYSASDNFDAHYLNWNGFYNKHSFRTLASYANTNSLFSSAMSFESNLLSSPVATASYEIALVGLSNYAYINRYNSTSSQVINDFNGSIDQDISNFNSTYSSVAASASNKESAISSLENNMSNAASGQFDSLNNNFADSLESNDVRNGIATLASDINDDFESTSNASSFASVLNSQVSSLPYEKSVVANMLSEATNSTNSSTFNTVINNIAMDSGTRSAISCLSTLNKVSDSDFTKNLMTAYDDLANDYKLYNMPKASSAINILNSAAYSAYSSTYNSNYSRSVVSTEDSLENINILSPHVIYDINSSASESPMSFTPENLNSLGVSLSYNHDTNLNQYYYNLLNILQPLHLAQYYQPITRENIHTDISDITTDVGNLNHDFNYNDGKSSYKDNVHGLNSLLSEEEYIDAATNDTYMSFLSDFGELPKFFELDNFTSSTANTVSNVVNTPTTAHDFSNILDELGNYKALNPSSEPNTQYINSISSTVNNDISKFNVDYTSVASKASSEDAGMYYLENRVSSAGGSQFSQFISNAQNYVNHNSAKEDVVSLATDLDEDLSNTSNTSSFTSELGSQISSLPYERSLISNVFSEATDANNKAAFDNMINEMKNDNNVQSALSNVEQLSNENDNNTAGILYRVADKLDDDSKLYNVPDMTRLEHLIAITAYHVANSSMYASSSTSASIKASVSASLSASVSASISASEAANDYNPFVFVPSNSSSDSTVVTSSAQSIVNSISNSNSVSSESAPSSSANKHHVVHHHYNVKTVPVGKSFSFKGMKAKRLSTKNHVDYRYTTRNIWLHSSLNMNKRNHNITLKKGSQFVIDKLYKLSTKHHHTYYRALIDYGGKHDAYAYITKKDSRPMFISTNKHKFHHIFLKTGLTEFRNANFTKHSKLKHLRAFRVFKIRRIVKVGKFGLTRIQLSNGKYISANCKYVKLI